MEQPWWQSGCVYQVYLRSFQDSNADGVGDLEGLRCRLPQLAELGIGALWLSPVHDSPDVDFGYDVADYDSVHPLLGTEAGLVALIDEAHFMGLKVILDGVYNHTSDAHQWFTDSRSRQCGREDWYIWRDTPNNWKSTFGGPAWTWCPARGQFYLHSFAPQQPDLNWRHPGVQDAVLKNMARWLDRGVDGFRLDVFNCYRKDPQLRDNPRRLHLAAPFYGYIGQHHRHDRDQDDLIEVLSAMRALTDRYPDRYLVGETLDERFTYDQAARWVGPDRLHAAFHFKLLHSRWGARPFASAINTWISALGDRWPTWVVGNHDFTRAASRWGGSDERARLLPLLLCGLRGTPFLYYGDEIGMREVRVPRRAIQDPPGKRFWPFYRGRDGCRTPMQWTDEPGAGFSEHEPWLPVAGARSVSTQQAERSIRGTWKRMLSLRRTSSALRAGAQEAVQVEGTLLRWIRTCPMESVEVVLNMGRRAVRHTPAGEVLLSTHGEPAAKQLRGYEGIVTRW